MAGSVFFVAAELSVEKGTSLPLQGLMRGMKSRLFRGLVPLNISNFCLTVSFSNKIIDPAGPLEDSRV